MDDRGRLAEPLKRSRNARVRSSNFISADFNSTLFGHALSQLRPLFELNIPRGAGSAAAIAFFAIVGVCGAVYGGHVETVTAQLRDARDAVANTAGFRIAAIAISGPKEVTREEVLAAAGVTGRSSLLFLDAEGARTRLKSNPWIADATILKLYPDRLHIAVSERQAFAMWQKDNRVAVIASDGTVVQPFVDARFANLPMVVGAGAEKAASEFLAVTDRFPSIRDQVKAYVLVAERRWNLRLKNGIDVRLPEIAPERALETLAALDRDKKLLSRDITVVDLRVPDRVTARLSDTAAAARQDAMKDKKVKRKGDDA
jgi:cell division protein FtsQ